MCRIFQRNHTSGNSRTTGLVRPNIQKKIGYIYLRTWDDIACKVHEDSVFSKESILQWTHARRACSTKNPKENNRYMRIWDDIMHVKYTNVPYFSKESYFRELTHDWTGSPKHPKEKKRYLSTWDDIRCKVHEDSVFSKESILQGTHARSGRFARTSTRKLQIYTYMRWYYACKVHECAVFFKGINTSGNSRTTGLVRPNIQRKITDICVYDMILCM